MNKRLLLICSYVFLILGCSSFDNKVQNQDLWKIGEIVYEWSSEEFFNDKVVRVEYYRQFLGVTETNTFLIQDYYKNSGKKYTDPYFFTDIKAITKAEREIIDYLPYIYGDYVRWSLEDKKILEILFANIAGQGIIIEWHSNGEKAGELIYKDGRLNGYAEFWHANNQKASQGIYRDNNEYGTWINWYDNGAKRYEFFYPDKANIHLTKGQGFYPNGMLHFELYYKNGKRTVAYFYENGSKKGEGTVNEKNIWDGFWQWWDKDGNLIKVKEY